MAFYKPDLKKKLFSECSKRLMFLDDLEARVPERRFRALVLQNHPKSIRTIVYFFLVGGCARHLQNSATKYNLPIG
jgi:hypothetical protein